MNSCYVGQLSGPATDYDPFGVPVEPCSCRVEEDCWRRKSRRPAWWNAEQLESQQLNDPNYRLVLYYLKNRDFEAIDELSNRSPHMSECLAAQSADDIFQADDGLWFITVHDRRVPRTCLLVPRTMYYNVWQRHHVNSTGHHFDARKTTARIRDNYWFPLMYSEIRRLCQSCPTCSEARQPDRVSTVTKATSKQAVPPCSNQGASPTSRIAADFEKILTQIRNDEFSRTVAFIILFIGALDLAIKSFRIFISII